MKPVDLIGCGALNLDLIYRLPRSFPLWDELGPPGTEQMMSALVFKAVDEALANVDPVRAGGGQAANTVNALARLGYAAAHITGGGFPDNVGRAVPDDLAAVIDLESWTPSPLFGWLHGLGVHRPELLKTFNCGLGMVLAMDPAHAEKNLAVIAKSDFAARVVGKVVSRDGGHAVRYVGELRV